jgi:hypothetical protein
VNLKSRGQCRFEKTATVEDKISMQLLETILEKMSSLPEPQKNFADFIDGVDLLARQGDV